MISTTRKNWFSVWLLAGEVLIKSSGAEAVRRGLDPTEVDPQPETYNPCDRVTASHQSVKRQPSWPENGRHRIERSHVCGVWGNGVARWLQLSD